ncbi:MAG TPA: M48 family metallopeptidase, partial [Sandaracinaceae bacterium LLY-WYZ-13_1]|nr:M48 family metallopeptidase [Sandaracinaceae bacterium LLY-WYZ-13_1]
MSAERTPPTIQRSKDPLEVTFADFVEKKKSGAWGRDETVRYAYASDVAMLRSFQRLRPVELAAAAVVRTGKEWMRSQLLGSTVKVGPEQFPSIHAIAEHCARTLTVPTPTIYIKNSPVPNAYTYGTDEESFIVIHSALIDHFDEAELKFVIGHETGHIQNKHVVYLTALNILTQGFGVFFAWIVQPALLALRQWVRRAEITCDRAGLLCSQDLEAASRSFMKLASGSQKLYPEMNLDAFLDQFEEGNQSIGRMGEAFSTHPYLPKRIHALRVFADSALYRSAT